MLDFSPLAGSAGGTPLVVLLAVLILDLVLGFVPQMGQLHPPLPGIRPFFLGLERRLNRERRSEANRLRAQNQPRRPLMIAPVFLLPTTS